MLSSELLSQIRHLQLRAGHLVTEALAGEYISAFKGQGMEFDEVREYVPGDDIRTIDWNVTARMRQPYVKVLKEEREQTLMIMVDVSPSQGFSSTARPKRELAAELAAVLAFLATRNNDKVGLIVFSDHVEKYIPPKKGRSHIWRIIREVLMHQGSGKRTDIAGALDYLMLVVKRRSLCFLISDFFADGFDKSLLMAARRHDLTCAVVTDQREWTLPPAGLVEFVDSETGDRLMVDTSDRRFASAYGAQAQGRLEKLTRFFKAQKIDSFQMRTDLGTIPPLEAFLTRRERRRR